MSIMDAGIQYLNDCVIVCEGLDHCVPQKEM